MKKKYGIILLLAALFFASCEYQIIEPEEIQLSAEPTSFSTDVAPMFAKCASCHTSSNKLNLSSDLYTNLTTGESDDGVPYVDVTNPEASLIYSFTGEHPSSDKLTAEERAILLKWITEGAPNN